MNHHTDKTNQQPIRNEQDGLTNVRLYHIWNDPNEYVDLSATYPEIVEQLLKRLAFYNSTAVPMLDFPLDFGHNPSHTCGAWVPWVNAKIWI